MTENASTTTAQDLEQYERLLHSLGSENRPEQWLIFMTTCEEILPEVMAAKGRIPDETIKSSLIGRFGFNRWEEMLQAPVSLNGLGLGKEKWRKFRAAWRVVNEHPYLKNLPLSYVAVNDLATEAKRLEIEFPADLQAYKEFRAKAQQRKAEEKQQKLGDLQAEIAGLKAKVQEQDKQIAGLQGENRILIVNNKEITGKLEQAMVQNRSGKKALKSSENDPEVKLTRWQHFKAFIFGER